MRIYHHVYDGAKRKRSVFPKPEPNIPKHYLRYGQPRLLQHYRLPLRLIAMLGSRQGRNDLPEVVLPCVGVHHHARNVRRELRRSRQLQSEVQHGAESLRQGQLPKVDVTAEGCGVLAPHSNGRECRVRLAGAVRHY